MIIVCDTSPITNLIRIDRLHLLEALYGQIIIPPAVYRELIRYERQGSLIAAQDWITTRSVSDESAVVALREILDPGEAEAIVLAEELGADALIIDERKGRSLARQQGLRIIGLLGVLVAAKNSELIETVKPIMDQLIEAANFRISTKLYQQILIKVDEC